MSTNRVDYVVFGVDVGYDLVEYDDFEAEIEGAEGRRFDMIYDGMNGNYAIAGHIIAKSDPYEGFDTVDIEAERDKIPLSLISEIHKTFPHVPLGSVRLLVFTHWH